VLIGETHGLHPVLDPAGHFVVSVYSSGAIGRLVPDDVTGLVRYLRGHSPAIATRERGQ
jgi:hypothetical protein